MANDVILLNGQNALVEPKRMNYEITAPNGVKTTLKRDVDFGVIPKTKKPSLYKSGAEKICFAYGLMQRYTVESKIEQTDPEPFFFYTVRCDLVKLNLQTGQEYVFTSGYGSANTKEKRNGFNGAYDAANSSLKMAAKRALTAAAISVCGGSDLFTMDIEDETVTRNFEEIKATSADNAPITTKQIKRLFAIGNENGLGVEQIKTKLASIGYTSTKEITQEKYDEVCKIIGGAE
jgi:hypothetical protein